MTRVDNEIFSRDDRNAVIEKLIHGVISKGFSQ